jgi:hypothetical protein
MSLILKKEPSNFEPHPITEVPVLAVVVDVTPVKEVERKDKKTNETYKKQVFRLVYQTATEDDDGKRFCIWSKPYSADGKDPLNEKANLRIDIKKILGRDLTAAELEGFDVEESLLGRVVKLMIDHDTYEGKVYDQITLIKAAPNEKFAAKDYIRIKDRKKDGDASYSKAEAPSKGAATESSAPADAGDAGGWEKVKVHVEGCGGVALEDLDEDAIIKLKAELEGKDKLGIKDKRLLASVNAAISELGL